VGYHVVRPTDLAWEELPLEQDGAEFLPDVT
jgi:hypothetical protein